MALLFKQLKNGDKFKLTCYDKTYLRKAAERSATKINLDIVHISPLTKVIRFNWSDSECH